LLLEPSAQGKDDNKEIDSKEKQSKSKASTKKDKRKADGVGPDGGAHKRTKAAKEIATPETKDGTLKPQKGKRKPTSSKVASHLIVIIDFANLDLPINLYIFLMLFVHRS
jgi:hypothetical protein